MTRRMPWDCWLNKAQIEEIAEGVHPTDAQIAEQILTAWPEGAIDARFDGEVVNWRGGAYDGYCAVIPQEVEH